MTFVDCAGCGSKELVEKDGIFVCAYCQTKNYSQANSTQMSGTSIAIASDIQALLQKCRNDPPNRRQFANLILDIDPTNLEAKRFLS